MSGYTSSVPLISFALALITHRQLNNEGQFLYSLDMSNPPDLDHELPWLSRPRIRPTADSMHLQLTIWIKQYNAKAIAFAAKGDLDPKSPTEPFEKPLIYEINEIQREINPPIRPWLAYGCGLAM